MQQTFMMLAHLMCVCVSDWLLRDALAKRIAFSTGEHSYMIGEANIRSKVEWKV